MHGQVAILTTQLRPFLRALCECMKFRVSITIFCFLLASCSIGVVKKNSLCDSNQTLPWETALDVLSVCEVENVVQAHSLAVNILLKNDIVISTKEPRIDEIFRVIRSCGKNCSHIGLITE